MRLQDKRVHPPVPAVGSHSQMIKPEPTMLHTTARDDPLHQAGGNPFLPLQPPRYHRPAVGNPAPTEHHTHSIFARSTPSSWPHWKNRVVVLGGYMGTGSWSHTKPENIVKNPKSIQGCDHLASQNKAFSRHRRNML